MKKVMDKKGEQALPLPVIIGIIVMAATAFIIIFFFSGTFGTIGEIFEKFPSVEIAAKACETYVATGSKTSYCNFFQKVEISETKQYATCTYLENYAEFEKLGEECDLTKVERLAKEQCQNLKDENLVNGKPCYIDGEGDDEWGLSRENPLLIAE